MIIYFYLFYIEIDNADFSMLRGSFLLFSRSNLRVTYIVVAVPSCYPPSPSLRGPSF